MNHKDYQEFSEIYKPVAFGSFSPVGTPVAAEPGVARSVPHCPFREMSQSVSFGPAVRSSNATGRRDC